MEPVREVTASGHYQMSLTCSPERPDGARISLLPEERQHSAAELQREFPDIADGLRNGRLIGPLWSERGTKYEASFATYGEFKAAFPNMAAHIRMDGAEPVDTSVPDVRLVVYDMDSEGQ